MDQIVGLQKGTVRLDEHNPGWKTLFEQEKKILLENFPDVILEVSHAGSTAIPGIVAKPIIDMFVIVLSLKDAEQLKERLEKLGYTYRGSEDGLERVLYLKGRNGLTTHYLHFVEHNGNEWENHILVKEYYLKHPEEAKRYEGLKKELARKYPDDRKSYTHGKDEFIKSIIKKAKEELK